jgi:hypothetical protein
MQLKNAVLAIMCFSAVTMYADTITVHLGQSNQNYTLNGTGGSNGYGTYLNEPGSCVMGAVDTTCTLSGSYTGTTAGYTAGTYSLTTTFANADGGIPSISSEPVTSTTGNYFILEVPTGPDVQSSLFLNDVAGPETIPLLVNGVFEADSYLINPVSPTCENLPSGVSCTQGNVGLYNGDSLFGPVTGDITFDTPASVPEPEWLALGGMIPGALFALRRRFVRAT